MFENDQALLNSRGHLCSQPLSVQIACISLIGAAYCQFMDMLFMGKFSTLVYEIGTLKSFNGL